MHSGFEPTVGLLPDMFIIIFN